MNDVVEKCKMFCTGCGLCSSIRQVEMKEDCKGFPVPDISELDINFCQSVCPALGGLNCGDTAWGSYKYACNGWSDNKIIRKEASSGGVLTSICLYLLKSHQIDGIIQTRVNENIPYATETVVSRTEKDVLSCMGSRYSISTPLSRITELVKPGEKYAFVGKPCDVSALRAYVNKNSELVNSIVIFLSFFCAGMPSNIAQKKLLSELGIKESECVSIQYRGNGWPGSTTAKNKRDEKHSMSYEQAWGEILGRDVRTACRFCIDGIGLAADIVCGDAWHLNNDGTPDFSENEGRNIVFARTDLGEQLLKESVKNQMIKTEDANVEELRYIQKYQYERRSTMLAQVVGLRVAGKPVPEYPLKNMLVLSKNVGLKKQLGRTKGVFIRCKHGVI